MIVFYYVWHGSSRLMALGITNDSIEVRLKTPNFKQ
jgi:hypothetical protein